MKQKIVVLTGAGISAESGVKTFRDQGGLWEGHDVMEVATPEAFERNPALVLDFYNQRRRQMKKVAPNLAHIELVKLEEQYEVTIITQNVDNLHERAGSSKVIHLHGELTKVRSTQYPQLIYDWTEDLSLGDTCERGAQLRPHIVWFGEAVPMLEKAAYHTSKADIILVIGTSMQVYPAAGLVSYAPEYAAIYYIDPKPHINYELMRAKNLTVLEEVATKGVKHVVNQLILS